MRALCLAAAGCILVACASAATPPERIVVVSDDNYPPYLFRDADGTLRGIVKDKWTLWSKRNAIPVEVRGTTWALAQESVRRGEADVIEALAHTPQRAASYEFPATPATMEAHIYFHRSISGIGDAASLRGFTVAAKEGSACAEWLGFQDAVGIRRFADSEHLIRAATTGDVKLFCMDALAAQYFLLKHDLSQDFRQSPALYSTSFDWAVRRGRTDLRDRLQAGFQKVSRVELAEIDRQWRGSPVHLQVPPRYLAYLVATGFAVLGFSSLLLFRNHCLRRLVRGRTAELTGALEALKKHAARAQYFATRDSLTGLANRQQLRGSLAHALARAKSRGHQVGVILIDLDRFKAVNDTFGQKCGDAVLKGVANRLSHRVGAGPGTCLARVSGDEFVMLLRCNGPEELVAAAHGALACLRDPFDFAGQPVFCTASAGVAVFPDDGATLAELLGNAAMAMNCAKHSGRNNLQRYRDEMLLMARERQALETQLRGALERNEFELHYQPRVALATGAVSGFEALLRWRHPQRGLLGPAGFIPVLEETGLIVGVGEWVLRTACRQLATWQAKGLEAPPIAVNLSARQFYQRDLDRVVGGILAETGVSASKLELELTESLLMREPEEAARTLERLKVMGVPLAVDDFGTGYSSLAYLKRFPIAALKIDRAFIGEVTTNPVDAAITIAIVNLAHNLGMKVVAEGVETEAQLEFLRGQRCDEVQGYLFSPPATADEAELLIPGARA